MASMFDPTTDKFVGQTGNFKPRIPLDPQEMILEFRGNSIGFGNAKRIGVGWLSR
jgi:hypothetical protein